MGLTIRAKANFPTSVVGAGGIGVSKANGIWTVEPDFASLAAIPVVETIDPSQKQVVVFDETSEVYNTMNLGGLGVAILNATSTTSLLIGTGSKVFETQDGKAFAIGSFVLATSDADETNLMVGQVTAYDNESLTVNVTKIAGAGTFADWTISVTGAPGIVEVVLDEDDMVSNRADAVPTQQSTKAYVDGKIIDEDTMVSDSAVKVPTQQSVKAYVDGIAGFQTYLAADAATTALAGTPDTVMFRGYDASNSAGPPQIADVTTDAVPAPGIFTFLGDKRYKLRHHSSYAEYFGVRTGEADCAPGMQDLIEFGSIAYVTAGDYHIATAVTPVLAKSLVLNMSPRARFYTELADEFQGSLIGAIGSYAAYDPELPIDLTIRGGLLDIRNGMVGTTIPYNVAYPRPAAKVSPTSSGSGGIGIRADVENAGTLYPAIRRILIEDVSVIHCNYNQDWRDSGGESSIFARGFEQFIARRCYLRGARDSAFYITGAASTTASNIIGRDATVEACRFQHCVRDAAYKREIIGVRHINNHHYGAVGPILMAQIVGDGSEGVLVSGNRFENYSEAVRLRSTKAAVVSNNTAHNAGYRFADGSKPTSFLTPYFGILESASDNIFSNNVIRSQNTGYTTARFVKLSPVGGVGSTDNTFIHNTLRSISTPYGEDPAVGAGVQDSNFFVDNNVDETVTSRRFVVRGPNSRTRNLASYLTSGITVTGVVADATLATIQAGVKIVGISVFNTTANAVTIKIGKTAGAQDVVASIAIGANALVDLAVLIKLFSTTATQALFISSAAWSSADLTISIETVEAFANADTAPAVTPPDDWQPTDLGAALKAWFNADDLTAGAVASWVDRVAALTVVQATGGLQPVASATAFNSVLPGVDFDGSDDFLNVEATTGLPTGATEGWVWSVNSFTEALGVTQRIVSYGGAAGTKREISVSTADILRFGGGNANLDTTAALTTGNYILAGRWRSATSLETVTGGFNGEATVPASAVGVLDLATATTRFKIGGGATGAGLFNGIVRHVFITGALTADEQLKLEGWIAWDSGLVDLLPDDHPYKYDVP